MLVLDTNVISEALRPEPDARVKTWLKALPPASVFTTAITEAEIFRPEIGQSRRRPRRLQHRIFTQLERLRLRGGNHLPLRTGQMRRKQVVDLDFLNHAWFVLLVLASSKVHFSACRRCGPPAGQAAEEAGIAKRHA